MTLAWKQDGEYWYAEAGPLFKLACWPNRDGRWRWQIGVPGFVPRCDPELSLELATHTEAQATAETALLKILYRTALAFGMPDAPGDPTRTSEPGVP